MNNDLERSQDKVIYHLRVFAAVLYCLLCFTGASFVDLNRVC